jgi:hypothetical protein
MNKEIKSHIYLAESILKRFSFQDKDKKYWLNYIDINTMQIKKETARKFNRELGYYTYKNEQKLKSNSEEKIGNVITKLENHRKSNKTDFILSKKDKEVLTKYLAYQWLRSDYLMQSIKDKLNALLPIRNLKNLFIDEEERTRLITKQTAEMGICIVFNNTSRGYVINSSTSVVNKDSSDYYIVTIILTPNIAVRYTKKDSLKNVLNLKDDVYITTVCDEKIILEENINTFKATYNSSPNFVVGRKKDLELLINNYK